MNISDSPNIINCGAIQKIDRVSFRCKATFLLFFSTIAAETIEKVAINSPMPTLCRGEIPESLPVNLRAIGTKTVSYRGTTKISKM